jgi:hypothetical protein
MGGGAATICTVFPLQAGDNRFVRFKPNGCCLGREMHRPGEDAIEPRLDRRKGRPRRASIHFDVIPSGRTERLVLPVPLHERLFSDLRPALQTSGRHFQNVIRYARIGARHAIKNVVEWQLSSCATGFAAGDHALRLLESGGINEYDVLLFWVMVH